MGNCEAVSFLRFALFMHSLARALGYFSVLLRVHCSEATALLRGHFFPAVRFVLNAPVPFVGRVTFAARFVVGGFPGSIVEVYNTPQA